MATIELIAENEDGSALDTFLRHAGFSVEQRQHLSEKANDQAAGPAIPDMVMVVCGDFSRRHLTAAQAHPLAGRVPWILISDGRPNQYLDELMNQGVAYHFRQPLDYTHLGSVLEDFRRDLQPQSKPSCPATASSLDQFGLLLGSSPAMRHLYRLLRRVSQTEANVLLMGESGSGKELAARTLHQQSPRAKQRFTAINCAALSPELVESELFGHVKGAFTGAIRDHTGVFEQCQGGTLFLDEITEMPLSLQSKLLRVLETGEFNRVGCEQVQHANVRVISASNRPVLQAIDEGQLREDLYFRLAHFPLQLPPLRERGSDIAELAQHFLAYRNQETGSDKYFSDAALNAMKAYHWPGNVRELKHCVERAHILADREIGLDELPSLQGGANADQPSLIAPGISLRDAEKTLILATLEHCRHNKTQAAGTLGVSVKTLYNKLERYSEGSAKI